MLYNRLILDKIKQVIPRDEFIILTGARQTGKTSILLLLKEYFEKKGEDCYYLNLENPDNLIALNKHPFNVFDLIASKKTKQYLLIDEIQYLDDPSNFLKLLYDEKRTKIKVIVSGSSSFYIDKKFKDSLVGRKFLFNIYSLNFEEYLIFNNQEELLSQQGKKISSYYKEKILRYFDEYLRYGAYPRIALSHDAQMKQTLLEEIGTSYIKKDVLESGVRDTEKYFALLKILSSQVGQLVNTQELSNSLRAAHKTIEEYIYTITKSYQAALIRPFYRNVRKELLKMPKVYFYDLGLMNFFKNNFNSIIEREDKGAYLENVFFREALLREGKVDNIKFWRTQNNKEVDFVINDEAYEIKFTNEKHKENKYELFRRTYPDIKFSIVTEKDILKIFYKFNI